MKLAIRDLPQGHTDLDLSESPKDLDLGDWIQGPGPVRLFGDVEHRGDQITIRGTVSVRGPEICGRCTREFEQQIETEVLIYAELRGREDPADEAALEAEGSIHYHDGIDLVLDDPVREAVILEVPTAPLCRPDCPGLCSRCGKDLGRGPCDC